MYGVGRKPAIRDAAQAAAVSTRIVPPPLTISRPCFGNGADKELLCC